MAERLAPDVFNDHIATLRPGDSAFHAMLHPGVYPGEFDRNLHAGYRAGNATVPDTPFYGLLRRLVAASVTVEWLWVVPEAGQFGYDEDDVAAMRMMAHGIGRIANVEVRATNYSAAMARLAGNVAITAPLTREYMHAVGTDSPSGSFWLLERTGQPPQRIVDVMRYRDSVFTGHDLRPLADEPQATQSYVDFWCQEHRYAKPVSELVSM